MAEWRFGIGWTDRELMKKLKDLRAVSSNFPESGPLSQEGENWRRYFSESIVAKEEPGLPVAGGPFELAWKAITEYQFSDPGIVTGHFIPDDPLQNRTMLLEIKVLGLKYLCGVRVTNVIEDRTTSESRRAFRYDTLEGHLEVGTEWFSLTKKHETGEIFFRISASWRPGQFPNWWSRVGFEVLGQRYQRAWHRLAYLRLRELVGSAGKDLLPVPQDRSLFHTGAEISNSNIWLLKAPTAAVRVQQAGKKEDTSIQDRERER